MRGQRQETDFMKKERRVWLQEKTTIFYEVRRNPDSLETGKEGDRD